MLGWQHIQCTKQIIFSTQESSIAKSVRKGDTIEFQYYTHEKAWKKKTDLVDTCIVHQKTVETDKGNQCSSQSKQWSIKA